MLHWIVGDEHQLRQVCMETRCVLFTFWLATTFYVGLSTFSKLLTTNVRVVLKDSILLPSVD